jgi:hypothetical protein
MLKKILCFYTHLWDSLRAEVLAALGMYFLAAALAFHPKTGTIHALWGESASLVYVGVFLAGATTSIVAMRTSPLFRPIVFALATLPLLGYALLTSYLFISVRHLDERTSLVAPLSYLGLFLVFQKLIVDETKYDDIANKDNR